ncbi:MAG: exosome complex exonuclease Rrp41 [Candidatus Nanoarchaeia archaeon]|nr:exosome complex exonuclease Rrp41 [Candidatus Nanoarchaeia archaeon]
MKRVDGRTPEDLRPIEAKAGVIKNAEGSGYFKIGKTWAYATVYGPKEIVPRFMMRPDKGILKVNYNMMPFSGQGERVRPGPNRRARELSLVSEKALASVLDLTKFKNSGVEVFIELPQTDAGSRCAGICAASIALADAGFVMKDMVAAVAVGRVKGEVVVDLSYEEEADETDGGAVDTAMAMVPSSEEVTLLQMDGQVTKEELMKAINMGKEACKKIAEIQREAIKNKYAVGDLR